MSMERAALFLWPLAALLLASAPKLWADAAPTDAAAVAPERLTRGDLTPAEYVFKQHVYRLHVEHGTASGRPRVYDLPASTLAEIPGTDIPMRRDAAAALGRLLIAARADLAADLDRAGADAVTAQRRARAQRVQDIAVNNAYRSASLQFTIWDRNYADYAAETLPQRRACPGGEFGEAAAALLRDYIGVRVAAPGFSNHQGGIAVDFALHLKPADGGAPADAPSLGPAMAQVNPWKESWLWDWLNRRAGEFGFVAYLPEPWHWEYKSAEAKA